MTDTFWVGIWPQFTQTAIQTEKSESTLGPRDFSLSNKSHFLGFESSPHGHTAKQKRRGNLLSVGTTLAAIYTGMRSPCLASGVQLSSRTHWPWTGGGRHRQGATQTLCPFPPRSLAGTYPEGTRGTAPTQSQPLLLGHAPVQHHLLTNTKALGL